MEKLKIFISGTQDDMKQERDAVDRAVNAILLSTGIRAETTVSQPQPPRDWIEQQIQECNIYIGIYSHRYGWVIPDEGISATEFEYNLACKLDKPILVWIRKLREEEEGKQDFDRQKSFLNRVSNFSTGHLRQVFDDLNDLEKQVADGLSELFTEMIRSSRFPGKSPKLVVPETPSWFQDPSFRNSDSPQENGEIQLETLATELAKDKTKRFAIVGRSGCGKTVAMAAIMHSLSSRDDKAITCIYVPLGDYAQSLTSTIKSNIGWQDVPDDRVVIELENLGAILLLDALNEVPGSQRHQCRNEIKSLMASYQGRIVLSFPAVDRINFNFECPLYEILPLKEQQIQQIAINYFEDKGNEKKAEWFLDRFTPFGKFSSEFLQWVELPLNLQFLLELGSEDQFDIRSIRDIYGQVIDRRFSQLERQEKKGKFPIDVMKECLADLAIQSLADDTGIRMSKVFAKKVFSRNLSSVDASELLTEIIRSGLLNETGDDVHWFHTSLRDYLAGYRLYTLTASSPTLTDFSIEQPQWNGAVAYAVMLSTMPVENQSIADLLKRPIIFNEYLQRRPAFEMVRTVVREYQYSHLVGDSSDRDGTEADFLTLQWGTRFLEAYHQMASIVRQENPEISKHLPIADGLKVFINTSGRFCTIVLADETGIEFNDLTNFDDQFIQALRTVKSCVGFCLHGYLLWTLDPEVIAFSQIVVWLNSFTPRDSTQYADGLRDISFFSVLTPNDWVDWQSQDAFDLRVPSGRQPQKVFFTWHDFYAPLTFSIDPVVTPSQRTPFATRTGSLVFTHKPASHISLMLLLPGSSMSSAVDFGTHVHIPMPPIKLKRDYLVDGMNMSYAKGDHFITFVRLRG